MAMANKPYCPMCDQNHEYTSRCFPADLEMIRQTKPKKPTQDQIDIVRKGCSPSMREYMNKTGFNPDE